MKTTILAALVVGILWFGYAFGYHCGMAEERWAWESTREPRRQTDEGGGRTSRRPRLFYSNPHEAWHAGSAPGLAVVNAPQAGTLQQNERPSLQPAAADSPVSKGQTR